MSHGRSDTRASLDYDRMAVEDAIVALLQSLDFVTRRNEPVEDADDDELFEVHQRLLDAVEREDDDTKRNRLRELMTYANRMRDQVLNLRRLSPGQRPAQAYYTTLTDALEKVTQRTYEQEYRKTAIILGIVECVAELLVLEVRLWGPAASMEEAHLNHMMRRNERKDIRKQIASVLTNLTFGSPKMKKLLADYDGFVDSVVALLKNAPNLVQPYSNLLRNMSWPACSSMTSLFAATRPLAKAAVDAARTGDDKSVKSALSALWNIVGSGGEECTKDVIAEQGCMETLLRLLVVDGTRTTFVEYSTGILKYVAAELVQPARLRDQAAAQWRYSLTNALLNLLCASSLIIVKNALCALQELFTKDAANVARCMTHQHMTYLEGLVRSTNDEMRRPAKVILSYAAGVDGGTMISSKMSRSAHHSATPSRDMTSSLRYDRLLPRRSPFCSPALAGLAPPTVPDSRSASLPRAFASPRQNYSGFMDSSPSPAYGNLETIRQQAAEQQQRSRQGGPPSFPPVPPPFTTPQAPPTFTGAPQPYSFAPPPGSFPGYNPGLVPAFPPPAQLAQPAPHAGDEEEEEDRENRRDEDDSLEDASVQVTRSSSVHSLSSPGSKEMSGFHSTVETANNSARLSPISYSELPDSPTQFAAMQVRERQLRDIAPQLQLPSFPQQPSSMEDPNLFLPSTSKGGSSSSRTESSDGRTVTPVALSAGQTPTFATMHGVPVNMPPFITPQFLLQPAPNGGSFNMPQLTMQHQQHPQQQPTSSATVTQERDENDEEDEDDDYGIYYGGSELLDRSIEEALPPKKEGRRLSSNRPPDGNDDDLLMASIEAALPTRRSGGGPFSPDVGGRYSSNSTVRVDGDDLLSSAIQSAMPPPSSTTVSHPTVSSTTTPSKNARAGCAHASTHTEGPVEDVREEEKDSDDSDIFASFGFPSQGPIVGDDMPLDVLEELEADRIAIDCSLLMNRKPRASSTQLPRRLTPSSSMTGSAHSRPRPLTSTPASSRSKLPSRLTTPRVSAVTLSVSPSTATQHATPQSNCTTMTSSHRVNGLAPTTTSSGSMQNKPTVRRPMASAVVSPYNYKPKEPSSTEKRREQTKRESTEKETEKREHVDGEEVEKEKKEEEQSTRTASQLLVTTV